MMNMTPVVKQLLIINIIFFIGSQFVSTAEPLLSLFYPENPNFKIWQLVTHMFMHGNLMHILFNMMALVSFGNVLEHFWGSRKFLFFYFSCGLGALLLHEGINYYYFHHALELLQQAKVPQEEINMLINEGRGGKYILDILQVSDIDHMRDAYNTPVLGASGAIYGLLVAFAFMFPNAELAIMFIPVPVKAKYVVPVYMILFDGLFGIFGSSLIGMSTGVAHFAHIGGALTGLLMVWYWKKNQFNNKRWN